MGVKEEIEQDKIYIDSVFNEVLSRFPYLRETDVSIVHTSLKGATMNARPVISSSSFISGISKYQIIVSRHVRDSGEIRVGELSRDVLSGWFAHELGHIMDYQKKSALGMVWFGVKYLISDRFRTKAEHTADQYAIRYGFHDEIIAAKRFLLENDLVTPAYRQKISKYYMTIDQVRWHTDNPHTLENLFVG
ncbi:MAG: hypothetical protein P8X57_02335 [Cyclobacteriaceae bacterium]